MAITITMAMVMPDPVSMVRITVMVMLNRFGVYPVVLLMCPDELY